jgi:hypothetical protein
VVGAEVGEEGVDGGAGYGGGEVVTEQGFFAG